jgi:hypothetical protein
MAIGPVAEDLGECVDVDTVAVELDLLGELGFVVRGLGTGRSIRRRELRPGQSLRRMWSRGVGRAPAVSSYWDEPIAQAGEHRASVVTFVGRGREPTASMESSTAK